MAASSLAKEAELWVSSRTVDSQRALTLARQQGAITTLWELQGALVLHHYQTAGHMIPT